LLRSLADTIEAQGIAAVDVLDVTIAQETTAEGPWWSGTVYWKPEHELASTE
jgi:hypothetical protein